MSYAPVGLPGFPAAQNSSPGAPGEFSFSAVTETADQSSVLIASLPQQAGHQFPDLIQPIPGSTIDLHGAGVASYILGLDDRQLRSLSIANRAELARLVIVGGAASSQPMTLGDSVSVPTYVLLDRLYESYTISAARLDDDRDKAQLFVDRLKRIIDFSTIEDQWQHMNGTQRADLMKQIEGLEASIFNFRSVPVYSNKPLVNAQAVAEYDAASNEMRIRGDANGGLTGTFADALTSVFHEGLHARQDSEIEAARAAGSMPSDPTEADMPVFAINGISGGYIAPSQSVDDYFFNPLEREAFSVTDMMRRDLGLAPVGPPYESFSS